MLLVGAVETVGGLLLLIGYATRLAAALLAGALSLILSGPTGNPVADPRDR